MRIRIKGYKNKKRKKGEIDKWEEKKERERAN